MPKTVTRYDVLISCPSDVGEYIENIKRSIHRFNSTYGDYRDVILRPKYWGDDSFAQSGGKAQELLNQQIVEKADIAIAVFWTKFGEPTAHFGSGTEEEIETMILKGKQVFLYFLDKPVLPSIMNIKKLLILEKNIVTKGFTLLSKMNVNWNHGLRMD